MLRGVYGNGRRNSIPTIKRTAILPCLVPIIHRPLPRARTPPELRNAVCYMRFLKTGFPVQTVVLRGFMTSLLRMPMSSRSMATRAFERAASPAPAIDSTCLRVYTLGFRAWAASIVLSCSAKSIAMICSCLSIVSSLLLCASVSVHARPCELRSLAICLPPDCAEASDVDAKCFFEPS
eukprot:3754082-Pleurochrysis_carterae.AAC.1